MIVTRPRFICPVPEACIYEQIGKKTGGSWNGITSAALLNKYIDLGSITKISIFGQLFLFLAVCTTKICFFSRF